MDSTTAVPGARARKPGILINRNFALLFGGVSISYIGDWVYDTTLVIWIATSIGKGQSWAPLAISGVLLATAAPQLLVGTLAGVFVDRWDKRRTMLVMDLLRAGLVALLLLATNVVPLPFIPGGRLPVAGQLAAIYAIVALASACAQFFNPARLALIGDIVLEEHRARATGLLQMIAGVAIVVGPALAAPLYFGVGVQWALLANAASFGVSFTAILLIRAPRAASTGAPGVRASFLREYAAGLRFFARSRVLMTLLITGLIIMSAAGALNALDIFFVVQNLHAPASVYGYFQAAAGVGLIAGSILASIFARRIGLARMVWLSIVLVGALLLVFSRLTSFVPALIVNGLIGIPNAGLNVAIGPLVLHVTPREMVGRVMAVLGPTLALFSLLSTAVAGYLDSTVLYGFHATIASVAFGPVDTIFTAGSVLAILGGLYAMVNLRGVQLAGQSGASSDSAPAAPNGAPEEMPANTPALV